MLVIRHSIYSRNAALLGVLAMLGMAGCTKLDLLSLRPTMMDQPPDIVATSFVAKHKPADLHLKPRVEPASDLISLADQNLESKSRTSSWCAQMRETTAAETTILRSPSLNGSLSENGKADLGLSLSYSAFRKATLLEQAAEVRCRKYLAETGLQVLVFVSPQNLTASGYRAKSDTILSQAKDIKRLRKAIVSAMNSGAIDREKATATTVILDRLVAEGHAARSQADRRISERILDGKSSDALGRELLLAEADIDKINSELTTSNNMDVTAQVGWSDDVSTNGVNMNDQSFSGKVSFSIKLGALDPRRFEHERKASEAKQRAISSEEGGAIWQVGVLRRAHERAISGLEGSQKNIDQALAEAKQLLAMLESEPQPEFEAARLSARVEILKLKSDRAGIIGSLAEIRTNLDRLKNG